MKIFGIEEGIAVGRQSGEVPVRLLKLGDVALSNQSSEPTWPVVTRRAGARRAPTVPAAHL